MTAWECGCPDKLRRVALAPKFSLFTPAMSTSNTNKETAAERLARLHANKLEEECRVQKEIEELEREAALEVKREEEKKRKVAERAAAKRAAEVERQQQESAARTQKAKGKKRTRTPSDDS